MKRDLGTSLNYSPVELSFGTSGLRGLVSDMTDLECYINTRGFLDFLLDTDDIKPGMELVLAGDLRDSTPRILRTVAQAISDSGCKVNYLGKTPIPAAAYYGLRHDLPVAMVTGSHIPADRNGIKFYKREGEVLKADEPAIKKSVAKIRKELYSQPFEESNFNSDGSLRQSQNLPQVNNEATKDFIERYSSLFAPNSLEGKTVIVYQHSSVAADILVVVLESLGASVVPKDRSEKFIAIDTENVTIANEGYFKTLAKNHPENFAIISADGDADRPFIIDEEGTFHRGDIVGAVTAEFLKAKVAAVPVSASDAVDIYLKSCGIRLIHTKIGSPFVIEGMEKADNNNLSSIVGWEVNGGFLTASDIRIGSGTLFALPTRDSFLPIVCVLMAAVQRKCSLSKLFKALPQRFTQAGLLDNFPIETSRAILAKYSENSPKNRANLAQFFKPEDGYGEVEKLDTLDGIRITFRNGDIAHVRPSGNAPQLRIYSVSNTQGRANEIVALATTEPNGTLRQLEKSISRL